MVAEAEAAPATTDAIDVLACNWVTVDIFQLCQLAFAGNVCLGLSAMEIRSGLLLRHVPRRDWDEVSTGLQLMSQVAMRVVNTAIRKATPLTASPQ